MIPSGSECSLKSRFSWRRFSVTEFDVSRESDSRLTSHRELTGSTVANWQNISISLIDRVVSRGFHRSPSSWTTMRLSKNLIYLIPHMLAPRRFQIPHRALHVRVPKPLLHRT